MGCGASRPRVQNTDGPHPPGSATLPRRGSMLSRKGSLGSKLGSGSRDSVPLHLRPDFQIIRSDPLSKHNPPRAPEEERSLGTVGRIASSLSFEGRDYSHISRRILEDGGLRVYMAMPLVGMEAEREIFLNSFVPELRAMCNSRGFGFTIVDPHHGCAQFTWRSRLRVCMEEIDRCHVFVGLCGAKYGEIVDWTQIPEEDESSLLLSWISPELRDRSLSELEFRRGCIDSPVDRPALIMVRDGAYDKEMEELLESEGKRGDACRYRADLEDDVYHRNYLISDVHSTAMERPGGVFAYEYVHPEKCARLMHRFCRGFIKKLLPPASAQCSFAASADAMHDAHAISRLLFLVRDPTSIIDDSSSGRSSSAGHRKNVALIGEPGCGKASLLAGWIAIAERALHPDVDFANNEDGLPPGVVAFFHSCGCTPSAASLANLLRRLYCRLFGTDDVPWSEVGCDVESVQGLAALLPDWLSRASQVYDTIYIAIDGVDRLLNDPLPASAVHDLLWLPGRLPHNVHIAVSTSGGTTLRALEERMDFDIKMVPDLTDFEREDLIRRYLQQAYVGGCDPEELAPAISNALAPYPASTNPFYVRLAVSEAAALPGPIAEMAHRAVEIAEASADASLLADGFLARMENASGAASVSGIMSLMCVASEGLTEDDFLMVLGLDRWTVYLTLSTLKPLLVYAKGRWSPAHDSLRLAVYRRYMPTEEFVLTAHAQLARHFHRRWRERNVVTQVIAEMPQHHVAAGLWSDYTQLLTDDDFVSTKYPDGALSVQHIITQEHALAFHKILAYSSAIASLDLSRTSMDDATGQMIANAIAPGRLEALSLAFNRVGDGTALQLKLALAKPGCSLRRLVLRDNRLSPAGGAALADALSAEQSTLKALDVGWNALGDEGARSIAQALDKNSTLETLDVENNHITAVCAPHIATAVSNNKTLVHLYLGRNSLGDAGACQILGALRSHASMQVIDLERNGLGGRCVKDLCDVIRENRTLKHIMLAANDFENDNLAPIAKVIDEHPVTLERVDLRRNSGLTHPDRGCLGEQSARIILLSVPSRNITDNILASMSVGGVELPALLRSDSAPRVSLVAQMRRTSRSAVGGALKTLFLDNPLEHLLSPAPREQLAAGSDLPTEDSIVRSLRDRFAAHHLYAYAGSALVFMNPGMPVPTNDLTIEAYYRSKVPEGLSLPPHVFAIANRAYALASRRRKHQAIVFCGRSGSGKTENVRAIVNYLVRLASPGLLKPVPGGTVAALPLDKRMQQAFLLLEAFCNRRSQLNNNASQMATLYRLRIGPSGAIESARVEQHFFNPQCGGVGIGALGSIGGSTLLNSWADDPATDSSGFHVLYSLLYEADAQLRAQLNLSDTVSSTLDAFNVNTSETQRELTRALDALGFGLEERRGLFRAVAAVVLMGRLSFVPRNNARHSNNNNNASRSKKNSPGNGLYDSGYCGSSSNGHGANGDASMSASSHTNNTNNNNNTDPECARSGDSTPRGATSRRESTDGTSTPKENLPSIVVSNRSIAQSIAHLLGIESGDVLVTSILGAINAEDSDSDPVTDPAAGSSAASPPPPPTGGLASVKTAAELYASRATACVGALRSLLYERVVRALIMGINRGLSAGVVETTAELDSQPYIAVLDAPGQGMKRSSSIHDLFANAIGDGLQGLFDERCVRLETWFDREPNGGHQIDPNKARPQRPPPARLTPGGFLESVNRVFASSIAFGATANGTPDAGQDKRGSLKLIPLNNTTAATSSNTINGTTSFNVAVNANVVHESNDPIQALALLDEPGGLLDTIETWAGDGEAFATAIGRKLARHPGIRVVPNSTTDEFSVRHSCGTVEYDASDWAEQNVVDGLLNKLLARILSSSEHDFIRGALGDPRVSVSALRSSTDDALVDDNGGTKTTAPASLVGRLRKSTRALFHALRSMQVHFVHCVLPQRKDPRVFEPAEVIDQLRSSNVVAAVGAQRGGYPLSMTFEDFAKSIAVGPVAVISTPAHAPIMVATAAGMILVGNGTSNERGERFSLSGPSGNDITVPPPVTIMYNAEWVEEQLKMRKIEKTEYQIDSGRSVLRLRLSSPFFWA